MNREEICKIIDQLFQVDQEEVLYYIRSLEEIIESQKAELLEAYKSIVEVLEIQKKNYGYGMNLHSEMITFADVSKQLKLKAEQYIKKNQ